MEPGPLVASGRDGDIFEFGPGRVLRRARSGRVIEREAHTITYAREHGYPVPEVFDVRAGGTEIVMERIDGRMMMDAMMKRPWTMPAAMRTLADLHDQLHAIVAPEWLRVLDADGDRFLHLDLHPLNVMMASRGPVVIDWGNAARGVGLTDVAMTYALMVAPRMPAHPAVQVALQPVRVALGRGFLRRYRGPALDARIAYAAELKCLDTNMEPDEVERLRRIARRHRSRQRAPG
jgi:aminoglycoside phosphotransferase (APT) family kinase protein